MGTPLPSRRPGRTWCHRWIAAGILALALAAVPGQAAAQNDEPAAPGSPPPADAGTGTGADIACVATGHVASSRAKLRGLSSELSAEPVHQLGGRQLESGQVWTLPDGGLPVVVLDADPPLPGATVSATFAGQEFELVSTSFGRPNDRYVTSVALMPLRKVTRSLGLTVTAGDCQVAVALAVDCPVWSTVVGASAISVAVLFGFLTVLLARLRKGGWLRRFLFAAPPAVLAGFGLATVLVEAGVVGPFDPIPWWVPVAGLGLAALLPLTRWRGRRPVPPASTEPPPDAPEAASDQAGQNSRTGLPAPAAAPATASWLATGANIAVALVAGAAIAAGAFLVGPEPAAARPSVVITPDLARIVFVQTVREAQAAADELLEAPGDTDHIEPEAGHEFGGMFYLHDEAAWAPLTSVEVGVPREQYEYPAWFVASGQFALETGRVVHMFARFHRDASYHPWRMSSVIWLPDEPTGAPLVDGDGWLAPAPTAADLVVDPAELPQRYADWHSASFAAGAILEDDLLVPHDLGEDRESITDYRVRAVTDRDDLGSVDQELVLDDEPPTVLWLSDGSALVSFTLTSYQYSYNSPRPGETISCDGPEGYWYYWVTAGQGTTYRKLAYYGVVRVDAWVPARPDGDAEQPSGPVRFIDLRPVQRLDEEQSVPC